MGHKSAHIGYYLIFSKLKLLFRNVNIPVSKAREGGLARVDYSTNINNFICEISKFWNIWKLWTVRFSSKIRRLWAKWATLAAPFFHTSVFSDVHALTNTFRLNGKQPGFSTMGCAFSNKSGVRRLCAPNTFNSLKHSVSIISFCQDIDTDPVLNFE